MSFVLEKYHLRIKEGLRGVSAGCGRRPAYASPGTSLGAVGLSLHPLQVGP